MKAKIFFALLSFLLVQSPLAHAAQTGIDSVEGSDLPISAGGRKLLNLGSSTHEVSFINATGTPSAKINADTGTISVSSLTVSTATADSLPALGSSGGKVKILVSNTYGLTTGVLSSGDVYQQTQSIVSPATAYNLLLQPSGGAIGIGLSSLLQTNGYVPSLNIHSPTPFGFHISMNNPGDGNEYWLLAKRSKGSAGGYADNVFFSFHNSNNTWNEGFRLTRYGELFIGGAVHSNSASDERLKENIQTLSPKEALALLKKLRPVTYIWKNINLHEHDATLGFIAQDVQKVFPAWVKEIALSEEDQKLTPNGKGLAISQFHEGLNAVFVSSLQELESKLSAQNEAIARLEKQNAQLKAYLCKTNPAPFCGD